MLLAVVAVAPSVEAGVAVGAIYGLTRGLTLVSTWIGDRFVERRPRWPTAGQPSQRLNMSLAATGMASFLFAVAIVR